MLNCWHVFVWRPTTIHHQLLNLSDRWVDSSSRVLWRQTLQKRTRGRRTRELMVNKLNVARNNSHSLLGNKRTNKATWQDLSCNSHPHAEFPLPLGNRTPNLGQSAVSFLCLYCSLSFLQIEREHGIRFFWWVEIKGQEMRQSHEVNDLGKWLWKRSKRRRRRRVFRLWWKFPSPSLIVAVNN